jgi:hypothetical protein
MRNTDSKILNVTELAQMFSEQRSPGMLYRALASLTAALSCCWWCQRLSESSLSATTIKSDLKF